MVRIGLIVGLLAAVGCGGSDKAKYYEPPGEDKDTGPSEEKDASVSEPGKSNGPDVKFTMPDPAKDLKDDTLITSAMLAVRCRATQRSGSKAKVASVVITLDKVNDEAKAEAQPATTKVGDTDEYEAKFDLSNRPNGPLKFRCVAKDAATMPNSTALALDTFLDLGPKVELEAPKNNDVYALRTPVTVKFQVTPQPLSDDDEEGAVKSVKLLVSGMEQEVAEAEDKPGFYQASIDFNDKTLFMVPPTSAEILVTASNGRTPTAATRSAKSDVKIDGDGPSIKVVTPTNGSIVHGEVLLKVTVEDLSGVTPGSLIASIKIFETLLKISEWDMMGTSYQHTFDTRTFGNTLTQLTINLTATDVVGNQTDPPASITVRLDNLPPVLDLDPPAIREYRPDPPDKTYCSTLFDPVGDRAVDDLGVGLQQSVFRVLVEDQANHAEGALADYYAGVDRSKVVLYAQSDPSVPLLIDTNGDGICDEINFMDLPESKQPTITNLTALEPRGGSYFPKMLTDYSGPSCTDPNPGGAEPGMLPGALCPLTDMFRVVAGRAEGKPPAVYGFMPTNGSTGECEGGAWEVQPIVGEGWRCLAARAEDTIGNVGISPPLRVCFHKSTGPAPSCPPGDAPSCTSNCTISAAQRYPSGSIWLVR
jgi:hypothetical protein